jgi:ribosome-associated toxin RatA of RatAB toxin-antitoxin module
MLSLIRALRRALGYGCFMALAVWGVSPGSIRGSDFPDRLAAGEIVTYSINVPGSAGRRGEATGVVAASPEKVWQVVTDVNNYQTFLPRMIRSRLVRFEELSRILHEQPSSAFQVEAILDPSPPDLAGFRIPGQRYVGYFYAHVEVPWPLRNRWYIVRVQWDESQARRHIYTCSWSLVVGNLRENSGEWKVEPFSENRTRLTYRVIADPGGIVPRSLADEFTDEILPQIIAGVRRRVAYR